MENRNLSELLAETRSSAEFYEGLSFFCACALALLCFVGIFGNSLSIYVFSRKHMRKKSINILLIGISCADMGLLLLAVPIFGMQPFSTGEVNRNLEDFNHAITAYVYPLATIFQTCSVWLFILITIERYVAVCHPFKVLAYSTQKRAVRAVIGTFCLAISYNLVRFWEYRLISCPLNYTCGSVFSVEELRGNTGYQLWYGTVAYFLSQFLLPCLIMAVFNGLIIRTVIASKHTRAALTALEVTEHKTSVMMVVIVLIFVLCYSLSFVLNLYEALNPNAFYHRIHGPKLFFINDLSNTLIVANSATTFIVYLILSKKYRKHSKDIMALLFCRNRTTLESSTGQQSFASFADFRYRSYSSSGSTPTVKRKGLCNNFRNHIEIRQITYNYRRSW